MRSLLLLPMLALATTASAGEVMLGVGGGVIVMDPLEVLNTAPTINPRVSYFFKEDIGLELSSGIIPGTTRIGDYPYLGLTPRLDLIGKVKWKHGRLKDANVANDFKESPGIRLLLAAGVGAFVKNTSDKEGGDPDSGLGENYVSNDVDFMVNAGPGLFLPLGNSPVHLRTDLRWILALGTENYLNRGDQFIDWEWTAGIGVHFGGVKDTDKDGIVDEDDACPTEAEDPDGFEDVDGCPDTDNDKDGVLDTDDKCPNDPEDMDAFEDADGCPDADNDGDGIVDADDACPLEKGHESGKGCPDEDGDGLLDNAEECPDEAGPEASFGCPDEDGDRVPDYRDECPTEPAPPEADPKRSDGCPSKVFVTKDAIKILDKVFFATGKATIKPASFGLLDAVVATVQSNPEIKKVQIEGHTDNVGNAAKNQTLSEERAASVMKYLTDKGVDASRLVSKGFGQDKPLDPETVSTTEGRDANRRVEFNITEQDKVVKTFERGRLEMEDTTVASETLKVKKAKLPVINMVARDTVCTATLTIDAAGLVEKVGVQTCVGLARSVTKRTLARWEFEPTMVDGVATRMKANLTMTYKAGKATIELDEKSVKPTE